jgi:hypothetical protein
MSMLAGQKSNSDPVLSESFHGFLYGIPFPFIFFAVLMEFSLDSKTIIKSVIDPNTAAVLPVISNLYSVIPEFSPLMH